VEAVREGAVQREVAHQAWRYEQGLQNGSIPKVGVNRYRIEEESPEVELHPYHPEQAEGSIRRTVEVVNKRDARAVVQALAHLREAAVTGQNIMPATMEAVRAYATLGEMTKIMKEAFGEFREPVGL